GRLDPATKQITEYQNQPFNGARTSAHTIRVDQRGLVWASGGPAISMFRPKIEKIQHYDPGSTYRNVVRKSRQQSFTPLLHLRHRRGQERRAVAQIIPR